MTGSDLASVGYRLAAAQLGRANARTSAGGAQQVTVESNGGADEVAAVVGGTVQESDLASANPHAVVVADGWRLDGVIDVASLSDDLRGFRVTKMEPGEVGTACRTHAGSTVYIFDDWSMPVVPPGRVVRLSRLEAIYRHWSRTRPEVAHEATAIVAIGSSSALVGSISSGDMAGRVEREARDSALGAIWANGRDRLPRAMRSEGPQTLKAFAAALGAKRSWTSTPKATPGFDEEDARALLRLADPSGKCRYIIASAWAGVPAIESVIRTVCPNTVEVLVSKLPFRDAFSGVLMEGLFKPKLGELRPESIDDVEVENLGAAELAAIVACGDRLFLKEVLRSGWRDATRKVKAKPLVRVDRVAAPGHTKMVQRTLAELGDSSEIVRKVDPGIGFGGRLDSDREQALVGLLMLLRAKGMWDLYKQWLDFSGVLEIAPAPGTALERTSAGELVDEVEVRNATVRSEEPLHVDRLFRAGYRLNGRTISRPVVAARSELDRLIERTRDVMAADPTAARALALISQQKLDPADPRDRNRLLRFLGLLRGELRATWMARLGVSEFPEWTPAPPLVLKTKGLRMKAADITLREPLIETDPGFIRRLKWEALSIASLLSAVSLAGLLSQTRIDATPPRLAMASVGLALLGLSLFTKGRRKLYPLGGSAIALTVLDAYAAYGMLPVYVTILLAELVYSKLRRRAAALLLPLAVWGVSFGPFLPGSAMKLWELAVNPAPRRVLREVVVMSDSQSHLSGAGATARVRVVVTSVPSDASVAIDGKTTAERTPCVVWVAPGERIVGLSADRMSGGGTVLVRSGMPETLEFELKGSK